MSLSPNWGLSTGLQGLEFRQPPIYRRLTVGLQVVVDLRKMLATEKSAVRRERGRMRTAQHQVFLGVDKSTLLLRVAPPEHEHQALAFPVEHIDNSVREPLPTLVLVAAGLPGFNAERCIEQEHALLGPMRKV